MAMVCGLDLHRRQITFDTLEVGSGGPPKAKASTRVIPASPFLLADLGARRAPARGVRARPGRRAGGLQRLRPLLAPSDDRPPG